MIKSKKLFARALYLVFALALVAGLSLVPAVAADSPADTDVGFELGAGPDNDTAEWSDAKASGTGAMGSYSVELHQADAGNHGDTYVQLIPPSGITFADFETDIADAGDEWSFWNWYFDAGGSGHGPQFELKFTDPASSDYVDIMFVQHSLVGAEAWAKVTVDKDVVSFLYWGPDIGSADPDACQNFAALLAGTSSKDKVLGGGDYDDYLLTRVRVELYESQPSRTAHIDDVTIGGVTYELEPIFLDAEYYSVGDTVDVTVPNFLPNKDPIRVEPLAADYTDGVLNSEFTVTATSDSDDAVITVALEETGANTGVFTASFATTNTVPVAEDEVYVQDGDEITVTYVLANDWGSGVQSADLTLTASVDDTAPTITVVSPEDDEMVEQTTPEIKAEYSDAPADIDETSVEIIVDGVDVTDDADPGASAVTYTPEDDLAEGSHDVTVNVEDNAGNAATESWSFRVVSWLESDSVACDSELDALDTVGVAVSITGDTAKIEVGRYASNPEPDAALTFSTIEDGFFDVKVTVCENNGDTLVATQVVIKFADANITAESTAHVFDDLQGMWLACSDQGYNPTDEFLWVKVREADTTPNISELSGTPFAISGVSEVTKGDFDDDGDIDIVDFVQFATAYGSELGDDNYNAIGDFDDDGDIDILDFVQFATGYGTSW